MKKCSHALLRASDSDKYDASECTFIIMSDARNQIVAFGWISLISSGDNFGEISTGKGACAFAPYCLGAGAYGQC